MSGDAGLMTGIIGVGSTLLVGVVLTLFRSSMERRNKIDENNSHMAVLVAEFKGTVSAEMRGTTDRLDRFEKNTSSRLSRIEATLASLPCAYCEPLRKQA